jgi:cellulose synthase/poly-beta-1,6-N-acetylglucosamine synthase-like glycosyltransferase
MLVSLIGCLAITGDLVAVIRALVGACVLAASTLRFAACVWRLGNIAPPPQATPAEPDIWPSYTVILALYREAAIVPQLFAAIEAIDYPRRRLQVIAALEADDIETIAACRRAGRRLRVELAFPGNDAPRTKPRALNAALAMAVGELLVVYDAEDRPHPCQLREAATRFATGGPGLGVVQSPLWISVAADGCEIEHQFRLDYAALFTVLLPFIARLGLPFPLGGTSNHIRRSVLENLGGWDAWNVTEDADLAYQIASAGLTSAMLSLPTLETAPCGAACWVAQRSRWLKGHMQTLGVHGRDPLRLGWRAGVSLVLCPGLGVLFAGLHGPVLAFLLAATLDWATLAGGPARPLLQPFDAIVLLTGWLSAIACMVVGGRLTGTPVRWRTLAGAPVYWALQSVALARALWQLRFRPYHWDKTTHLPSAR